LFSLQELREAGTFAAVRHGRVRVREPGELLAPCDLRLRTNGHRSRPVAHNQLYDFTLGSVLAGVRDGTRRPAAAIQVQTWVRVGIHTVLGYTN
jgi:hypothetical protein